MLVALTSIGCDWIRFHFLNSIPFTGDPSRNPVVRVYLGVDGVPFSAVQAAMAQGAFSADRWNAAKVISIFPATSDAAWTRMFHTCPIEGYEYEYYDSRSDQLVHAGLAGTALHVLPHLFPGFPSSPPYFDGFDFKGSGYFHPVGAYLDPQKDYGDTLDQMFSMLEGRAETQSEFTGYILNLDVMGHIQESAGLTEALVQLGKRIERFKESHPERTFLFTLFSDHGMDFVPVAKTGFVRMDQELEGLGVTAVEHLQGRRNSLSLSAIPVVHTRVTYVSLHTVPENAEEVAQRVSLSGPTDVSVFRTQRGEFGAYAEGKKALSFSYNPTTHQYHIDCISDLRRFGLEIACDPLKNELILGEPEAFDQTVSSPYPDLFYRIRTGLTTTGVQFPAEVIVSFRHGYASIGFEVPGGHDGLASSYSFHGALDGAGSVGMLLTEERKLPSALRLDSVLDLFPNLRAHLVRNGVEVGP